MGYDIFSNVAIVVSFLMVIGQLFKNHFLNSRQSMKTQILLALIFGVLGVVLMLFTIEISETVVIIDLRNIAVICAGVIGGPVASILTAVIIGVFRIMIFGVNTASVTAFAVALLIGIGTACLSISQLSWRKKLIGMALFAMIVSNAALFYLIAGGNKLFETLGYYWVFYLFGFVLTYFTLEYILSANLNLKIRKEVEQELRVSNAKLKAIFENAGVGIVVRDGNGAVTDVNPAYLEMLGYSQEKIYHFEDIIHPGDIEKVNQIIKDLSSGKYHSSKVELRYLDRDRQTVYAEVTCSVVPDDGNTVGSVIYIVTNITERKKMEEELEKAKMEAEKLASVDFLTGIMNRRAFMKRLEEEFHRSRREKYPLSLIMADLDYFKRINDTYGHQAGDFILQKFAQCLTGVCRPYDFIARYGGEEFIVCLPNTHSEGALRVAERMRGAVEELTIEWEKAAASIRFTASFGVATSVIEDENNIESLISQADNAMYKAKAGGRNMVCGAGQ